jgi:hypothetical protein
MVKPKQLVIIFYVNACVKRVYPQTIIPCSVTFPSPDRVCDDRIRHLNHLQSLIVLSQERRCHMLRQNYRERAVGMVQAGMTHHAVAVADVSRITISRLMIRLRQTCRTIDRPLSAGHV